MSSLFWNSEEWSQMRGNNLTTIITSSIFMYNVIKLHHALSMNVLVDSWPLSRIKEKLHTKQTLPLIEVCKTIDSITQ